MIRIKGGRIIDPANGIDKVGNVYIKRGKFVSSKEVTGDKVTVIDAKGKIVAPGFIDMHVHLREPGQEYKETIASGCRAAAAGGFTSVVCMPNTNPVCDNAAVVEYIIKQAQRAGSVHVYPMGAISKGSKGVELAEIGDMLHAGAVAITDDGIGVMNASIMRAALEYAKNFDIVVCAHAEDKQLSAGGHMHEGYMSTKLGLAGTPSVAESAQVARDVQLCEYTDSRYHVQHISTKEAVEIVRRAQKAGLRVTCEAAPHHWTFTDEALETYDTHYKMSPPLRSKEHVRAIRKGLKDGTISVIATDHAPHSELEKKVEFDQAANGITGLETALSLSLDLVRDGVLDMPGMIEKLTINPARLLGMEAGTLDIGKEADVVIFDPELEWTYTKDEVRSKSYNSPWLDKPLKGRAVTTIARGKVVHQL